MNRCRKKELNISIIVPELDNLTTDAKELFKKGIEKVKEFSKYKIVDIKKSLEKAMNEDGDIKSALKEIKRKMEDALD